MSMIARRCSLCNYKSTLYITLPRQMRICSDCERMTHTLMAQARKDPVRLDRRNDRQWQFTETYADAQYQWVEDSDPAQRPVRRKET